MTTPVKPEIAHIHLRVPEPKRRRYVQAARAKCETLGAWAEAALDRALFSPSFWLITETFGKKCRVLASYTDLDQAQSHFNDLGGVNSGLPIHLLPCWTQEPPETV